MSAFKRLSVNTSLKNARLFDEYLLENSSDYDVPKTECAPTCSSHKEQDEDKTRIKQEIKTEQPTTPDNDEQPCTSRGKKRLRCDLVWNIKQEISEDDSLDEVKNENLFTSAHDAIVNTYDENIKAEGSNQSFKTAKKSVFSRLSPYHKPRTESSAIPEKVNKCVKNLSLGQKRKAEDDENESDPAILARRQKQIDFGKNTIGYDNYIRTVPRYKRTRTEPRTPDKYRKYSRRSWDSLIKHWRLQLHNYD